MGGAGEFGPQCGQWMWAGFGEVGMSDSQQVCFLCPTILLPQPAGHPLPLGLSATQREAVPWQEDCCCGGLPSSSPGLGRDHGHQGRECLWWLRVCSLMREATLAYR